MEFDINRPWLTLDDWQKEYIFKVGPDENCFLLCGRQVGKTTAMSIKAVELCIKHFKKGEYILICSITEKQAYYLLAKALVYAEVKYSGEVKRGKDKPTMHKIHFKNGTGILCYAAGETGEGLRCYTIKKLMIDEGSRMSEEFFIAVLPMLSIIMGSMDISSTPAGKKHKNGKEKYFYVRSKDERFKKFYVSAEDCPRHSEKFLENARKTMSKLAYAQEFLAIFTDELKRLFDDDLIKEICVLKRILPTHGKNYLGIDVAGLGKDECTFESMNKYNDFIKQFESIIQKRKYTTDTTKQALHMDKSHDYKQIGVDDAGVGFGVFSELLADEQTRRKVIPLNNASRSLEYADNPKQKRIFKEDMYVNLLAWMENKKIKLLDDDEVKASLASIQHEDGKIFGSYSHVVEGIIRAVWLAAKDKSLNIWIC